jgi:fimbrial chaperone protein
MMSCLFRTSALMAFAVIAGAFLPCSALHAMSVTPLHAELVSSGTKSRTTIKVTNTSTRPLPVETVVRRVVLDENGSLNDGGDGADDFLIIPAQAMIAPGASQVLRVQWVGEPLLDQSRTYRMSITQLPVGTSRENSQAIQVVFSFGVIINVAPPKGAPALEMAEAQLVDDASGKRRASLIIRNPSRVHALFSEATVHLSAGTWRHSIQPAQLRESVGLGLVQPGLSRRFTLPVDVPGDIAAIQASIDFTPPARH